MSNVDTNQGDKMSANTNTNTNNDKDKDLEMDVFETMKSLTAPTATEEDFNHAMDVHGMAMAWMIVRHERSPLDILEAVVLMLSLFARETLDEGETLTTSDREDLSLGLRHPSLTPAHKAQCIDIIGQDLAAELLP